MKFTQKRLEQPDVKVIFVVQVTGTIVWRMLQINTLILIDLLEYLTKDAIGKKRHVDQGV